MSGVVSGGLSGESESSREEQSGENENSRVERSEGSVIQEVGRSGASGS